MVTSPLLSTPPAPEFYRLDIPAAVARINADLNNGLSTIEAAARLAQHGPNQFGDNPGPSAFRIAVSCTFNAMNAVLFIALLIAAIANDVVETVVLAFIILLNSYLAFRQEYKSEKTMDALRMLSADRAQVMRDGVLVDVEASALVPGDLVFLNEGDHVPADIRLVEALNLSANEALLTGEPMPIRKNTDTIAADSPLGDRRNLVFKSTAISYGRGKGIVVGTGANTEIGKIADAVQEGSKKSSLTPLERTMRVFMFSCLGVAIILGVIVFWVNNWDFTDPQVLLYAIATAVAILPEGLPAITTVCMAMGVSHMAEEKAIVRKLVSLELLGMITDLCTDKTGTLTEGRMSAVAGWVFGCDLKIIGSFMKQGALECSLPIEKLKPFLELCSLCTTCSVKLNAKNVFEGTGASTEIALAIVAHRHDYSKESLVDKTHKFYAEYPFDSTVKRMSVIYQDLTQTSDGNFKFIMYTKGALESILPRCSAYYTESGTEVEMPPNYLETVVIPKSLEMANKGLRVLCLAMRKITTTDVSSDYMKNLKEADHRNDMESGLVLLGLVGIQDPPRPETAGAVADCLSAGIQVRMVTGDHAATAGAIARQVGIVPPSAIPGSDLATKLIMTASDFDKLSDEQLDKLEDLPLVIARCSPETKVKMIKSLHRRNKYVSMTGDGVNDAPSIANADVGISMGLGGADVTKQASAITLTDDNFATIVKAIAQGRRIFANIVKFTGHLLSANVSEVVALIIGLAFADGSGDPIFPMSPIQILWLNMITATPVALALAMEPPSPRLMCAKPRTSGVFTTEFNIDTGVYGLVMGGLTLLLFSLVAYIHAATPLDQLVPAPGTSCNKDFTEECEVVFRARSVAFVSLSVMLLFHGINCRFPRVSMFHYKWSEAKVLLYAIALGLVLIVPLPYIPFVNQKVFYQSPFGYEWGYVAASTVFFMAFAEVYKLLKRYVARKFNLDGDDNQRTGIA